MRLIADSGSSKTHWVLIENGKVHSEYITLGMNPFFIDESFVVSELDKVGLSSYKHKIKEIIFYGAGCSHPERNNFLSQILKHYFNDATHVTVDHDMKGASIALFGNKKGIACILGTGSNSCVYDGTDITENMPAIGYILGDEAGGAYYGKELLKHFIYKTLPAEIQQYLTVDMQLDKEEIFDSVYKKPLPNRYLASFSTIYTRFQSDSFIQEIIHRGLDEFIQYHILCYKECKEYPIGFVGSIAYYFKEELTIAMKKHGLTIDYILKNPIEGIINNLD